MRISNYILIMVGIILFLVGGIIEYNNTMFSNKEMAGYLGHFLFVSGIFIFFFQFVIWLLKILIYMFREVLK